MEAGMHVKRGIIKRNFYFEHYFHTHNNDTASLLNSRPVDGHGARHSGQEAFVFPRGRLKGRSNAPVLSI